MWGYYTAVVLVGIGFLTMGLGWTLLGLSAGLGSYFGFQYRREVAAGAADWLQRLPKVLSFQHNPFRKKAAERKSVEQTGRHWLFSAPTLADIRGEGFQALSESFLLLKQMTPFHSAALFEYDPETRLAYPRIYSTGAEGFRQDAILSVSDGVVGYCLSSGKTVHYNDFKGDSRLLGYYSSKEDIRSVIVFPLDRADRRLGALALDAKVPDAFSARIEEIRHVANLLAELLVRVQREESLLIRLEEDRTLKAMTERMAKAGVSLEDVAESLCKLAKDVFPADRVTFVVFDETTALPGGHHSEDRNLEPHSPIVRFRSLKMLDRYVELVARTLKTVRLDDLWENGLMSLATGQAGLSTHSILAAPFVFESQVVGVVLLESDRRRAFNTFHETAIGELVCHAAVAVARAIEYGRMEKTCAIADVVPSAADRIFSEPSLEPAMDLLKSRFNVTAAVFEVLEDKMGEIRLRPWETQDDEPAEATPFQKKSVEMGAALVRINGNVTPSKETAGVMPAGADIVFPLGGGNARRSFGLFCLSTRSDLRAETLQILDRIKSLIQIRLVLERRERQFGFLKVRDPLTGIFHTAAFEKKLEERIRQAKESVTPFQLIVIQSGRFSALKRSHGFAESLRRYATLCSEAERLCGTGAVVGRLGPSDLGVIWNDGAESLKWAKPQIERLSETLGFQIYCGHATFPQDADTKEALIQAAANIPAEAAVITP